MKEQDQDQDHHQQKALMDYKISSVLSLKDVLFLSMLDSYFPGIFFFFLKVFHFPF